MRFFKTPFLLQLLFPQIWWKRATDKKVIYLTFDDGPIPHVTEFVLEQLSLFNAKATFFCVGENVIRNAAIGKKVLAEGHVLGNHTHRHKKAWELSIDKYLLEVEECEAALYHLGAQVSNKKPLFRPPHGQLTLKHLKALQYKYQVVMWSSLTYDFDITLEPEVCLQKTIASIKPGSIVVMHDSLKAERNLRYVLPKLLQHFTQQGFTFESL